MNRRDLCYGKGGFCLFFPVSQPTCPLITFALQDRWDASQSLTWRSFTWSASCSTVLMSLGFRNNGTRSPHAAHVLCATDAISRSHRLRVVISVVFASPFDLVSHHRTRIRRRARFRVMSNPNSQSLYRRFMNMFVLFVSCL